MKKLFPHQALNAAYRRMQIDHDSYMNFLKELEDLVNNIKEDGQDERMQTDLLINFLNNTFYKNHKVASVRANDIDLAIRLDNKVSSNVGVMFEVKKLGSSEMPTENNLNTKALHELILYYMRQRNEGNVDIRNLVVTNTRDFFIFDAKEFERLFFQNTSFRKNFRKFETDVLTSGTKTDFFYKEIAKPELEKIQNEIEFTYFSLKDYKSDIKKKAVTGKLTHIYRLLSPVHLLKLPFQNDSNYLDNQFYKELLHIIGLEEVKENGKTVICRKTEHKRSKASLLENTLNFLITDNKPLPQSYGTTQEKRFFNAAMELCVTWINRVLFLKLLEAQLINYHHDKKSYKFLTYEKIGTFNALYRLFFQVMAVEPDKRDESCKLSFPNVPYLNSSLFEQTELERQCFSINALDNRDQLPILPKSVLHNDFRYNSKNSLSFLEYLFEFLDAYNFSSEGTGDVAEKPKSLINASVLGLIFEKINGYKDGSVYTPGFITRYMCKNAIRQAVLQKFNDHYNLHLKNFDEIFNSDYEKKEVNELINSLKICDPAVGSGHFLVSALNEIILIKSKLGCLFDANGKCIRSDEYEFSVENDELIITDPGSDDNNELWKYKPGNTESNRIQEAIFNEKRTIIENCLFGVDINPNSVNICRLRLWIELLKNAYYTKESNRTLLETLPNIDINIKCGNSLLYKFKLDSLLSSRGIQGYKSAVRKYKCTKEKQDKVNIDLSIDKIKQSLSAEIMDWMDVKKEFKAVDKFYHMLLHPRMFEDEMTEKEIRNDMKRLKNVEKERTIKKKALDNAITNRLFGNGFEWRLEFPEILNEKGEFVGFDLIIGNPPYGVSIKGDLRTLIVNNLGKVPDYEIYYFFIQLAKNIVKNNGIVSLIIPNTFLFNQYASNYRLSLFRQWKMDEILDLTKIPIFQSAVVRNTIIRWTAVDTNEDYEIHEVGYKCTRDASDFSTLISRKTQNITKREIEQFNQNWGLAFLLTPERTQIINKIISAGKTISVLFPEISQGLIAYDKYRGQSPEIIMNRLYHHSNYRDGLKQWLWGEDVQRFRIHWNGKEYIDYCDGIANPRNPKFFRGKRILIREITNPSIFAALTDKELYHDPAVIVVKDNDIMAIEAVLGILNSKMATFFHFNHSPKATKGAFPKILVQDIKDFPIPDIPKKIQEIITAKVNDLMQQIHHGSSSDVSNIEKEIDEIVYHLYDLTYDEVLVIDPQTPISREKYESFNLESLCHD